MPIKYKVMGPYMQMPKGSPDYFAECAGLKQEFSTVLLPFCISLNVPFIDATTALKERTAAGDLVFQPFDTHLNSLGHEIVAGLVADFVKTMQWNGSVSNVVARP
jgi:lysophospholipase L1-like esterase